MHENDKPQVMEVLKELEQFFGVQLSPMLAKGFITYCLSSFATFEDLEMACELLAIHEPNYGRFPPYDRLRTLLSEHKRTTTGAYQQPSQKALPPAPEERGLDPSTWVVLTDEEILSAMAGAKHPVIERLRLKVDCSEYFSTHKTIEWGTRYLREAITEAEARNIPLDLIGIVEAQAVAA
jgi:hypothetical protein